MVGGIVPVEVYICKLSPFLVHGEGIVILQNFLEVLGMLFANIFNSKVVHYQDELDRSPCVSPQPGSSSGFIVAKLLQSGAEDIVDEAT